MRFITVTALLALSLGGCAKVASYATEIAARGVIGKIDNDGGVFGVNTSTIINTPEQQAQKERDAALKQQYPLASGGDKGTVVINQGAQGGGQQYGGQGGYGGGYGYGPPPWGYDRGW